MAFHYSVLDLSPIGEGGTAAQAFQASRELGQLAERWGYRRFWLAEHHSMRGIASAATSLVISHVAAGTQRIRVGAGGIMLPNHSPLVIAEQFGTLETLYPGRIDLGLGRAPGSDQATARALRRQAMNTADSFPDDVAALQAYFRGGQADHEVRAVPGEGLNIPLWILGSSLYGAQFAAYHGLPYSFASHFAPSMINEALQLYRQNFRPSAQCDKPTVMLGLNVFAADTEAQAQRLFSSLQQQFLALIRGRPGPLPPPVDDIESRWSAAEKGHVERTLACSVVGGPDQVAQGIKRFVEQYQPDEIILTAQIFDVSERLHSFEIAAQACQFVGGSAVDHSA